MGTEGEGHWSGLTPTTVNPWSQQSEVPRLC